MLSFAEANNISTWAFEMDDGRPVTKSMPQRFAQTDSESHEPHEAVESTLTTAHQVARISSRSSSDLEDRMLSISPNRSSASIAVAMREYTNKPLSRAHA